MSLVLYENERKTLDQALASGGGTVSFTTHGQAVQFRKRLYAFRKLYRDKNPMSQYDRLIMPRLSPDSTTVVIDVNEMKGVFIPNPEGKPVTPPESFIEDDDPLFLIAKDVANDIL